MAKGRAYAELIARPAFGPPHRSVNNIIAGAIAGFSATVPMTAAMAGMHKMLPRYEKYPLPPRLITENVLEKADVAEQVPENSERQLALVNHFAYGLATGAIYASGLRAFGVRPTVANGVAFGLAVWAGSYQALLPMVGLFPPADEQPARRNALMIAAHIVWGGALGLILSKMEADETKTAQ